MENKIKQLRKGILELAILGSLENESLYGFSLIKKLASYQDINLTEGTIYPILSRLSKEGLVKSEWRESHQGPPRKYYSLSQAGQKAYQILSEEFKRLSGLVYQSSQPSPEIMDGKKEKTISIKKGSKNGQ